MQSSLSGAPSGGTHIRTDNLNGNHGLDRTGYVPSSDRNFILEEVDPSQLGDENDDSHSDSEATDIQQLHLQHGGEQQQQDGSEMQMQMGMGMQKPSKKTKGRVKIKMEFIENKLRRYTTFSKRKTGIMKKAYELSTLTGTQVMLLVASETGHVYTFATRKLQPMITSDSGKALIQTCLNSPDQGPGNGPQGNIEQRMNPTGFEETELTYTVAEEEAKPAYSEGMGKPLLSVPGGLTTLSGGEGYSQQPGGVTAASVGSSSTQPYPVSLTAVASSASTAPSPTPTSSPNPTIFLTQPPQGHATPTPPPASAPSGKGSAPSPSPVVATSVPANISMQLPSIVFQHGTPSISVPIQQMAATAGQTPQTTQAQAIFGLPGQTQYLAMANLQQQTSNTQADNTVTAPSASSSSSSTSLSSIPSNLSLVSASGSGSSGGLMTPNYVMYQTAQGVVYATPASATLNDRTIFNFQQPATAISMPQQDNSQVGAGQLIIPIPVSLAGSGQQFLQFSSTETSNTVSDLTVQPSRPKKSRSK